MNLECYRIVFEKKLKEKKKCYSYKNDSSNLYTLVNLYVYNKFAVLTFKCLGKRVWKRQYSVPIENICFQ